MIKHFDFDLRVDLGEGATGAVREVDGRLVMEELGDVVLLLWKWCCGRVVMESK